MAKTPTTPKPKRAPARSQKRAARRAVRAGPVVPQDGAAVVRGILQMSAEDRLRVASAASAECLVGLIRLYLAGTELDVPMPKLLPGLFRARFAVEWAEDGSRECDVTIAAFGVKHFPDTLPNLWKMLHMVQMDLQQLLHSLATASRYLRDDCRAGFYRYQMVVTLLRNTLADDPENAASIGRTLTSVDQQASPDEALQAFVDFHERGEHLAALWGT
jgi:hypothetical protein